LPSLGNGGVSRIFGLVRRDGLPGTRIESEADGQPVASQDRRVWLVADARVDNRGDLLAELGSQGLLDGEPEDAGFILAAWLRWGPSCLDRLLGDFAFAVWDRRARRLFVARDPLGLKPLFFAQLASGLLAFASQAQQLLRLADCPRKLDRVAAGEYLAGLPQGPRRSFFQGIERLPPGHRLTADAAGWRTERWWRPPVATDVASASRAECAAHLRTLFERAVADRLRTSGTAVGVALSGGLDSGSIAAAARARTAAGGPAVLGSTFVFDQLHECDERHQVEALAGEIGLEVIWIPAERHLLLSDAETSPPELESPFVGWQACHRQALDRLKERGGNVLLTGHGGDDLLRGSALVYFDRLCRGDFGAIRDVFHAGDGGRGRATYRYLVRPLLQWFESRVRWVGRARGSPLPDWLSPELIRQTGLHERIATLERPGRPGRMAAAEIRRVALDAAGFERIAHWHERHGQSAGVSVRHPFLDRRLFEYVLSLPPDRLFDPKWSKPLLREAVAGLVPDVVRLRRDKPGFDRFLRFSLDREKGRIEEILRSPWIAKWGLVDANRLRTAWTALRSGEFRAAPRTFWFALTLEVWLRRHHEVFDQGSTASPAKEVRT
jgi:asparagine synthase (glutamine-hydrolysing)